MDYFEDVGMLGKGERLRFAYLMGFALSLALTFGAYVLVTQHLLGGGVGIAALLIFALAQFLVQLIFFLHLGRELSSRARVVTLASAFVIVSIVILGSIWIMYNLGERMMSPQQMEVYMQRQPGI